MLKLTAFVLCSGLAVAVVRFTFSSGTESGVAYRTELVQRRSIVNTISATGTLEPCDIIDVGAQIVGRVIEFGTDLDTGKHLDYGSRVTKGMVLARIDPSVYEIEVDIAQARAKQSVAQLAQAKSQLVEAEAAVRRSEAELLQQQSRLDRAERDWQRTEDLVKTNSMSQSEVDSARSELETAQASIRVAQAAIEQARSRVDSQRHVVGSFEAESENSHAGLKRARTTLEYCSIVSPIDGVIIDRRVNQGQTVVAGLSAPSLFLLASDLRQLEIWVSVNEADIGQIKPKMPVRFSVDALPDRTFEGSVKQVRMNASMSQNVVTYTVVVSVDNNSDALLPYLTANVEFILSEQANALSVSAAALRFRPKALPEDRSSGAPMISSVFVAEGNELRETPVEVGISDGSFTSISSNELNERSRVAIGYAAEKEAAQASNPFVPKMPGTEKKSRNER